MLENQKSLGKQADPRFTVRIAIFHGPYQKTLLTNYAINISTGGVFIESSMILPEDTEITIKFTLPDSDTIIITKARVAWTNDPPALKKPAFPPGMGLQFLGLSLEDLHVIRVFLDKGAFEPTW